MEIEYSGMRNIGLVFSTLGVGKATTTFIATVRSGVKGQNNMMKFNLEGTGALATIKLLDPSGNPLHDNVSFERTLINSKKERLVTIWNDGNIAEPLAITADPSSDVSLDNYDFFHHFNLEPKSSSTCL